MDTMQRLARLCDGVCRCSLHRNRIRSHPTSRDQRRVLATAAHLNAINIDRRTLLAMASLCVAAPPVKAASPTTNEAERRVEDFFDALLLQARDTLQTPIHARLIWWGLQLHTVPAEDVPPQV